MEYTVEQIIKSLRACEDNTNCSDCVFFQSGVLSCYDKLKIIAADMLEALTAPPLQTKCDKVKIVLDEDAKAPTRAHKTDAGLDLYARESQIILPKDSKIFDTGVHIQLPQGTVGMVKSKSGLNVKAGLTSEGVIDEGYTGSIVVKLYNHSNTSYTVNKGDKIAQLVIMPCLTPEVEVVDFLETSDRGNNGFGSSGV